MKRVVTIGAILLLVSGSAISDSGAESAAASENTIVDSYGEPVTMSGSPITIGSTSSPAKPAESAEKQETEMQEETGPSPVKRFWNWVTSPFD